MSVSIDIEYFKSWSEIFREIERQNNLKLFTAIEPGSTNERKPSLRQGRRRSSTPSVTGDNCSHAVEPRGLLARGPGKEPMEIQSRSRSYSTPTPMIDIDPNDIHRDSRLTDAAQKLSGEEMALLYEDILKPLDVFSILCKKRKQMKERDQTVYQ